MWLTLFQSNHSSCSFTFLFAIYSFQFNPDPYLRSAPLPFALNSILYISFISLSIVHHHLSIIHSSSNNLCLFYLRLHSFPSLSFLPDFSPRKIDIRSEEFADTTSVTVLFRHLWYNPHLKFHLLLLLEWWQITFTKRFQLDLSLIFFPLLLLLGDQVSLSMITIKMMELEPAKQKLPSNLCLDPQNMRLWFNPTIRKEPDRRPSPFLWKHSKEVSFWTDLSENSAFPAKDWWLILFLIVVQ